MSYGPPWHFFLSYLLSGKWSLRITFWLMDTSNKEFFSKEDKGNIFNILSFFILTVFTHILPQNCFSFFFYFSSFFFYKIIVSFLLFLIVYNLSFLFSIIIIFLNPFSSLHILHPIPFLCFLFLIFFSLLKPWMSIAACFS